MTRENARREVRTRNAYREYTRKREEPLDVTAASPLPKGVERSSGAVVTLCKEGLRSKHREIGRLAAGATDDLHEIFHLAISHFEVHMNEAMTALNALASASWQESRNLLDIYRVIDDDREFCVVERWLQLRPQPCIIAGAGQICRASR